MEDGGRKKDAHWLISIKLTPYAIVLI